MSDIRTIIRQLREIDNALFERRLAARGSDERLRLRAESHRIEARIEQLQAAMFKQATRDFAGEVAQIDAATAVVKQAAADIDDLNAVLAGVASVLRIVDTVLGLFP